MKERNQMSPAEKEKEALRVLNLIIRVNPESTISSEESKCCQNSN
jgi:hypothetical protein